MDMFRAPMNDVLDSKGETVRVKLNYSVKINPDNVIFAFGDDDKIAQYLSELSSLEIMSIFMTGEEYE